MADLLSPIKNNKFFVGQDPVLRRSPRPPSFLFKVLVAFCLLVSSAQASSIEGLGIVTFRVSHLEESLAFYRDLLGLPIAFKLPGSVFLRVNGRQYVELVPDLPASENIRLSEIRFEVSKLDDLPHIALATPAVLSRDGTRIAHFIAPDNQPAAFVKYLPDSLELRQNNREQTNNRISRHLLHTGIVVQRANLDTALRFYKDDLGFTEFWRGGPEGAPEAWINLRTSGSRHDYIELMLADGQPDRKRLGSMQHICLEVPDIQAASKTVNARDTKRTQTGTPKVGRNGKWQLNLFDPDGSRIELMEPNISVLSRLK